MSGQVILSAPGATIYDGNDALNQNSDKPSLKYYRNIALNVDGTNEVSFAHGLTWAPIVRAYQRDPNGWYFGDNSSSSALFGPTDGALSYRLEVSADINNLYVRSSLAGVVYVEILVDKAALGAIGTLSKTIVGYSATRPGSDIRTVQDAEISHDNIYSTYKVLARPQLTISWSAAEYGFKFAEYEHGLGYVPKFMAFSDGIEIPVWTSPGYEGQEIFGVFANETVLRVVGSRTDFFVADHPTVPYEPTRTFTIKSTVFIDEIVDTLIGQFTLSLLFYGQNK